jgi:alpha-1,3-fucosyltransferase 10
MAEERRGCVRDQLILFRTRDRKSVPVPKNLPTGFTFDQSRLREADAVVFHIPEWSCSRSTFEDTPKFPGQLWIAYSMESKVNYKQLADQEFTRHFDLRMTYEQDADIWVPYLPRSSTWLSIQGSSIPKKIESHPTALFRSDPIDRCGRNAFAVALMRYTKVDSYGKFLKNRSLAESDLGWSTRLTVMSRYHFYLALENSIAPDYVTEKILML